ncbi:MAG: flagellar basal body P-ring protein FlgI [Phycisphaerales bacterium]
MFAHIGWSIAAGLALCGAARGQGEAAPLSPGVTSIQDMVRIEGQGESVLRGFGIVTGLKGSGDSGQDLVLARPLAQVYKNNGNELADPRELAKAKSAALVMIECVIPKEGARRDDEMDVFLTVSHSASSLAGGRLLLAPLTGPFTGDDTLYAMASGPIVIEDPAVPTVARVRGGARMVRDVLMPLTGESFNLIVHPHFRGWTVTDQLADTINSLAPEAELAGLDGEGAIGLIARAVDDASVQVVVPEVERINRAKFLSRVLSASFSPSLLRLPAQVIVNSRTGSIIVTGNVEISPVAVSHKDLIVSTTRPVVEPTPQNPRTTISKSTTLQTTGRSSERGRIQDLLAAMRQLDVPINDQISILTQMHRAGRLHARLIVE